MNMHQNFPFRLKCNSISYRSGFIEVIPAIHENHVNIEVWDVRGDTALDDVQWVDEPAIQDSDIQGNCEIEMTMSEATKLAKAILAAVDSVENDQK